MNIMKNLKNFLIKNSLIYYNNNGNNLLFKNIFPKIPPLYKLFYSEELDNEEFNELVSHIYYKKTWKTTLYKRNLLTDELILKTIKSKKVNLLEVGASTGVSSLYLFYRLRKHLLTFYLTDYLFNVKIVKVKNSFFFYDTKGKSFIVANKHWTFLLDKKSFFPVFFLAKRYFRMKGKKYQKRYIDSGRDVVLLDRRILKLVEESDKIRIEQWDTSEPWNHEQLDIIKVANVLNLVYLKKKEIINIVNNLKLILKDDGLLFITENREKENLSVFQKNNNKLILRDRLNKGAEIEEFIEGI